MSRVCFVNGRYVPFSKASLPVLDRSITFADSVYEVIYFYKECCVCLDEHLMRLQSSLLHIGMSMPWTSVIWDLHIHRLIAYNRIQEGIIYIQVSRGIDKQRSHMPSQNVPSIIILIQPKTMPSLSDVGKVFSCRDQRWARVDIKTTNLLPNILARYKEPYADEVIFIDDKEYVTEASAANVWIVDNKGWIKTPRSHTGNILEGIMRKLILKGAVELGYRVCEEEVSLSDIYNSREMFLTSSSKGVFPIVSVDNMQIGDGQQGPITVELSKWYRKAYLTDNVRCA